MEAFFRRILVNVDRESLPCKQSLSLGVLSRLGLAFETVSKQRLAHAQ